MNLFLKVDKCRLKRVNVDKTSVNVDKPRVNEDKPSENVDKTRVDKRGGDGESGSSQHL